MALISPHPLTCLTASHLHVFSTCSFSPFSSCVSLPSLPHLLYSFPLPRVLHQFILFLLLFMSLTCITLSPASSTSIIPSHFHVFSISSFSPFSSSCLSLPSSLHLLPVRPWPVYTNALDTQGLVFDLMKRTKEGDSVSGKECSTPY